MTAFLCPKCGGPSQKEGLCKECMIQSAMLLSCPDIVEVAICSVCGSRLERGRWQISKGTEAEQASEAVRSSLCVHKDLEDPKIDLRLDSHGSTRYIAEVRLRGMFMGDAVEESCRIPVRIKRIACERCSRIAGKYFEAIVQVRGSVSRQISEDEARLCGNLALSMAESGYQRGDQLSFIQDIRDVKGGIDIVLGSAQLGRQLARAITERFGGRIRESSKLFGRRDGRDIYRTTLLVRFPRLKKGDVISFRNAVFEVTGFDHRRTLVTSLAKVRRSSLSEEEVDGVKILGNREDALKAIVVAKDENVLEIMDPVSYKTVFAPRPGDCEAEPGAEVAVIRTANGLVIVG